MTRRQTVIAGVIVGLLIAVGAIASQSGGGSHPRPSSGVQRSLPKAHQAGVSTRPRARAGTRSHRRVARKHSAGGERSARRGTANDGGIVVSTCDYRDSAAPSCGSVPPPNSCHLRDGGALQDPRCTPGATDPHVTQADLHSTICVSGYTDTVRPATSYTTPLEYRLIRSYGLSITPSQSELDHLISLELGGAPADPRNLFPEPYAGRRGARDKDVLENRLHSEVCAGEISLVTAQHEIVDWVKYQPPSTPREATSTPGSSSPSSAPAPAASSGSNCDPNYSGACLDPNASDYDCVGGGGDGPKFVQGPVRVVGTDRFQLDADGDGVACE